MRRSALIVRFLLAAAPAAAQEPIRLTLTDALERARVGHPAVARSKATRLSREADATGALAAYLPRVSAEWSFARTDDPVAVFGSKLRQGRFAAADLALDALNRPAPVSNVGVGVLIEQPLVSLEGWSGRRAAVAAADAGRFAEARALQAVEFDALAGYFGATLAAARVGVTDTALTAANRILAQVRAMRREGVVTGIDEQLVLARVSELEAQRAAAAADRLVAEDRLLLSLGEKPGQLVVLLDSLAPDLDGGGSGSRLDLEALRHGALAAGANVDRVRAQRFPSLAAFGSLVWNRHDLGVLGGPRHWTAGLAVRWTPFRGLEDEGQIRRARAERDLAQQELAAAERSASAEVRAAEARREAALAGVAAADRALDYANQAAQVAAARYTGGVATISELLAVRAAEAAARLARLDALYQNRVSAAALRLARGSDPR